MTAPREKMPNIVLQAGCPWFLVIGFVLGNLVAATIFYVLVAGALCALMWLGGITDTFRFFTVGSVGPFYIVYGLLTIISEYYIIRRWQKNS